MSPAEIEERDAMAATLDLLIAITTLAIGREERDAALRKRTPSDVHPDWSHA